MRQNLAMRRLNVALLASLQLCGARATSSTFNIHEDLLAFPQFEVLFTNHVISEKDARLLLDQKNGQSTYSADFSQPTIGAATNADLADANTGRSTTASQDHTYEIMNMSPHRYLCSIPVVQAPPPENKTETELAKASAAKESDRAAASGWELMSQLNDSCLYFGSGWWSYSFCNNREIVQYHALPSIPNGQPPRRDPNYPQFYLGKVPALPAPAYEEGSKRDAKATDGSVSEAAASSPKPVPAELAVKGDQRYLVQKLEGGTICDLTGRERTVEVQYHCAPEAKNDRIGWIKEVTICSYLMVINTPRLCSDVAFQPPQESKATPINCQLISDSADGMASPPPLLDPQDLAGQGLSGSAPLVQGFEATGWNEKEVTIGGIAVGARKILSLADEDGKPPVQLARPKAAHNPKPKGGNTAQQQQDPKPKGDDAGEDGEGAAKSLLDKLHDALSNAIDQLSDENTDVVAEGQSKKDGGKVTQLSDAQLEELDLDPVMVAEMRDQMISMAGDSGWKLEVVEVNDGEFRELRGYLDDEPSSSTDQDKGTVKEADPKGKRKKAKKTKKGAAESEDDLEEGSQEQFFKGR